jgi:hypothetical protein
MHFGRWTGSKVYGFNPMPKASHIYVQGEFKGECFKNTLLLRILFLYHIGVVVLQGESTSPTSLQVYFEF